MKTFVLLAALATLASAASPPEVQRFTAYTRPLELSQGEVTNAFHKLEIPKGPIAVYRFEADVVEHDAEGNVVPVPTFDAYLHHHVVGSNHKSYEKQADQWAPMKPGSFSRSVGFGAGTECRGTPQEFYYPYAFITVDGEDEWIANVHIINTRKLTPEKAHHCLECPCTSNDEFTDNAVNGIKFVQGSCNAELRAENNTVCAAATYHGGLRCCEDAALCLEKKELASKDEVPTSTYFLRYTIEYTPVTPEIRPLYIAGCCDATGDFEHHGNVEYDIPACDPELHPGCVHTLATRQRLSTTANSVYGGFSHDTAEQPTDVELVFAVGHQHRGGLGISIYNDATGDLICASMPKYGKGHEVLNENGYITAMSTCTFNPPLRMKSTDVIRIVSLYNNTLPHTGAMSLMYLAVSDVQSSAALTLAAAKALEPSVATTTTAAETKSFFSSPVVIAACAVAVVAAVVGAVAHQKKRSGYVPLARPSN
jgi:hypothetical protein